MLVKLTSVEQDRRAIFVNAAQVVAVRGNQNRTEIVTTAHGGNDRVIAVQEAVESVVFKIDEAIRYVRG